MNQDRMDNIDKAVAEAVTNRPDEVRKLKANRKARRAAAYYEMLGKREPNYRSKLTKRDRKRIAASKKRNRKQ